MGRGYSKIKSAGDGEWKVYAGWVWGLQGICSSELNISMAQSQKRIKRSRWLIIYFQGYSNFINNMALDNTSLSQFSRVNRISS